MNVHTLCTMQVHVKHVDGIPTSERFCAPFANSIPTHPAWAWEGTTTLQMFSHALAACASLQLSLDQTQVFCKNLLMT